MGEKQLLYMSPEEEIRLMERVAERERIKRIAEEHAALLNECLDGMREEEESSDPPRPRVPRAPHLLVEGVVDHRRMPRGTLLSTSVR